MRVKKKKEEKICITRYDIIERETYRKIKDINEIFKIDVCPNIIIPTTKITYNRMKWACLKEKKAFLCCVCFSTLYARDLNLALLKLNHATSTI